MAKRRTAMPMMDESFDEAAYLERTPIGGFIGRETRPGDAYAMPEHDEYTHRHNPSIHHSRSLVDETHQMRERREPTMADGVSLRAPLRADLDNDQQ